MNHKLPAWKDNTLFTPGPLTTSRTVKQAMLRDLGSRDYEFIETVRDIRRRLIELGEVNQEAYTAVIMQGSGTFGIESVIGSTVPPNGKLLVIVNGAYGDRMVKIAETLRMDVVALKSAEDQWPDFSEVERVLQQDPAITNVAVVHCETTTGILNPIETIGALVKRYDKIYIVDAMSSFGAVPVNLARENIHYLVSSSNKCIEGVPGFSFILAHKATLLATAGYARSVSLDLLAQHKGLESNGQFRFTPPTHALLAFHQALLELEEEDGVSGRGARYQRNHQTLMAGMQRIGFRPYLPAEKQGYIITSFYYPSDPVFHFETFYQKLNEEGYTIYPGKLSHANCFRIGHIGRIFENDVRDLLRAIGRVIEEMGVQQF